jgi:hypothetical protein
METAQTYRSQELSELGTHLLTKKVVMGIVRFKKVESKRQTAFWGIAQCSLVEVGRRFRSAY